MKKTIHILSFAMLLLCGMAGLALNSCTPSEIVSSLLESDMQHGLSSVRHPKGARLSQKGQAKEAEKMKKDGKCPTCRGMGKTPDGRYVCTTCNGTGKYEPTDDSTDKKQ